MYANPFFPPETAYAPSELDPKDPDFDPHPCPKPRLLFPTPVAPPEAQPQPETPPQKGRSLAGFQSIGADHGPIGEPEDMPPDLVDDAGSDEEELPARRGMLFGPGGMKRDREPADFEARKRTRA